MSPQVRQRPPATRTFDLAGHSIRRVLRQEVISRCLPFGNFGGGANLLYVMRLFALHFCGAAWMYLALRIGDWTGALRAALRRRSRG